VFIFLNSIKHLIFLVVKCGVLFEVRNRFLYTILTKSSFKRQGFFKISTAGLLASSQYASGRSCDLPSRHRFSWFSSVFKQMLRWFPNSKLLLHASHASVTILNSSKLLPVLDAADSIIFQIIDKTIRNSKFRCLSEANSYYHNVFTFTLFLPEGRAGVAWEPSNKMMLFLPPRKIKCLSLHPLIFSLNLLFIYPSHLSLCSNFKQLI
jgi:hypothetical protein